MVSVTEVRACLTWMRATDKPHHKYKALMFSRIDILTIGYKTYNKITSPVKMLASIQTYREPDKFELTSYY